MPAVIVILAIAGALVSADFASNPAFPGVIFTGQLLGRLPNLPTKISPPLPARPAHHLRKRVFITRRAY